MFLEFIIKVLEKFRYTTCEIQEIPPKKARKTEKFNKKLATASENCTTGGDPLVEIQQSYYFTP